ncbi:MAG: shikimate kinase [Isosphaeraceae bacterium]
MKTTSDRHGLSLVGYRGTGKSTVGRRVAEALGLPFLDADAVLEARCGRSIASIFAESGEPVFRDEESRTLAELTGGPPAVLATGGGAILRESNRSALRRFGRVVWLRATPETLAARLRRSADALRSRPPLTALGTVGEIQTLLEVRTPLYEEVSDWVVETDGKSAEQVAREIVRVFSQGTSPTSPTPDTTGDRPCS